MNLETKITIYKFTPQVFTLTRSGTIAQLNESSGRGDIDFGFAGRQYH